MSEVSNHLAYELLTPYSIFYTEARVGAGALGPFLDVE